MTQKVTVELNQLVQELAAQLQRETEQALVDVLLGVRLEMEATLLAQIQEMMSLALRPVSPGPGPRRR
ncbi:MAG: hypothetical protein Q8P22_11835 [Chloroflexota bacterium]|nr:hypothetical protein [Chloroflexota bacterium]